MCAKKRVFKIVTITKIKEKGKSRGMETSAKAAQDLKALINTKDLSHDTIDKAFNLARLEGKKRLLPRHISAIKEILD